MPAEIVVALRKKEILFLEEMILMNLSSSVPWKVSGEFLNVIRYLAVGAGNDDYKVLPWVLDHDAGHPGCAPLDHLEVGRVDALVREVPLVGYAVGVVANLLIF